MKTSWPAQKILGQLKHKFQAGKEVVGITSAKFLLSSYVKVWDLRL